MNLNWSLLSFFLLFYLATYKLLLSYLGTMIVQKDILSSLIGIFYGILSTLYLLFNKKKFYQILPLIENKLNYLLFFIFLTAFIIYTMVILQIKAYISAPNPGYAISIINMDVIPVTLVSMYLFKKQINIKTVGGMIIALIGIIIINLTTRTVG